MNMRMIRIGSVLLVLVAGILTVIGSGGGGGGGGPTATVVPDVPAGIYWGSVTPDVGPKWNNTIGVITTDGQLSFLDEAKEFLYATGSDHAFDGTLFSLAGLAPLQGEVTSVDIGGVTTISGTFTSPLTDGTFAYQLDTALTDRGADLSKLAGTWVDGFHVGPPGIETGTTTWVIQADGTFTMTSTTTCEANGSFSLIDPTKNEYAIDLTLTNCTFDGAYGGAGLLIDALGSTDNYLIFIFSNGVQGAGFGANKT
jgi:hypothetical protein